MGNLLHEDKQCNKCFSFLKLASIGIAGFAAFRVGGAADRIFVLLLPRHVPSPSRGSLDFRGTTLRVVIMSIHSAMPHALSHPLRVVPLDFVPLDLATPPFCLKHNLVHPHHHF